MLSFTLIDQPTYDEALKLLSPARDRKLLVLYHGELARREFLSRILAAAGYDEPGTQLHLLEWPADGALDLMGLIRGLEASRVVLFGYELPQLGMHFEVANYLPIRVAGVDFLVADSLAYIEDAKNGGDNRPAGALWNAIKDDFAHGA